MQDQNKNIAVLQKLSEGTSGSDGMNVAWTYYDKFKLATGQTHYDYFTVPQGQSNKSIADSNFPLAGQMPVAQKLIVSHVGLEVSLNTVLTAAELVTLNLLLSTTVFSLIIQNKAPMFQLAGSTILNSCFPVVSYETGFGIYVSDTIKTGYYKVAESKNDAIVLAAQTAFLVSCDMIGGVPASLVDKVFFKFNLKGRLLRTT